MDDAVRGYIDAIALEYRPLFDRIHRLVLEANAEAALVLSYQMPTFTVGRHPELVSSKGTIQLRPDDAARIPDDELRDLARACLGG